MTVKVRPYRRGGWEVDIMLTFPGRQPVRERRRAPVGSKSAAKRWGEERERQLIQHYASTEPDEEVDRPEISKKEVPTLAAFIPRYVEGHCNANRQRPATIKEKNRVLAGYLVPSLGRRRLDRISAEDIQRFKGQYGHLKNSTVNAMLALLRNLLNVAVEWDVIDKPPVRIKMLKKPSPDFHFYDFDEFDRLVLAAEHQGSTKLAMVLLGGEAGLRCGEIIGLQWSDVDLERDTLSVVRSVWRGHEGPPKSGRSRTVPLAPRLKAALVQHRHLRGPRVLYTQPGTSPCAGTIRDWLIDVQEAIGMEPCGPHVLRHTFCSHLAMQGAPPRVIQELAGHQSLSTTEQYMHLAPAAVKDAIERLRRPPNWRHTGDDTSRVIELQ